MAILKLLVFVFFNTVSFSLMFAQRESSVSFSASTTLVSNYIWRGIDMGHTASVQPDLSVSWKNFTLGTWSAFRVKGDGDDEVDFYLSKEIGPVSLALWDYWSYRKDNPSKYLNYNNNTTSHLLEGQLFFNGEDIMPFNLLASYFFYGQDPSKSIYLELQYVRPIKKAELVCFAGFQPKGNYYAKKASFVNVGVSFTQPLKNFGKHSLDLLINACTNPESNRYFFTAGICFYKNQGNHE